MGWERGLYSISRTFDLFYYPRWYSLNYYSFCSLKSLKVHQKENGFTGTLLTKGIQGIARTLASDEMPTMSNLHL